MTLMKVNENRSWKINWNQVWGWKYYWWINVVKKSFLTSKNSNICYKACYKILNMKWPLIYKI